MIALPLSAGVAKVTTIWALPAAIVGCAGAFGIAAGVAGSDADDAALSPTPLVATTENVYGVPSVRPVTVQLSVLADAWQAFPPGEAVTV